MVSTTKRTTRKAAKKRKPTRTRPDFARARKAVDKLIEDNVDWLKAMAKR